MATMQPASTRQPQHYVYNLQGSLLEACSCDVLCPCWIGENPDQGTCDAFVAYHFDKGEIGGVDVGGLEMIMLAQIPGNVLAPKSWKIIVLVDDRATDEQVQALTNAYTGKLGGPLADLAQLVGEIVALERIPIKHDVRGGHGTLQAGEYITAAMEPYRGPDGSVTTLRDSVFSTMPGSPAYVSKASVHRVDATKYGANWAWSFEGRNAIQGDYHISYSG
ncbi:MAG TPA: DUF1326 domain-containing protein [Candidatus Baltobacteraceae bacterium]|nr:DUF1326 domain-containing protein [Candidatus Baltobacteraceae bacterium]